MAPARRVNAARWFATFWSREGGLCPITYRLQRMPRVLPLFRFLVLCLASTLLAQERTPIVHPDFRADPSLVGVPTALCRSQMVE